jgi:hypothetical protein
MPPPYGRVSGCKLGRAHRTIARIHTGLDQVSVICTDSLRVGIAIRLGRKGFVHPGIVDEEFELIAGGIARRDFERSEEIRVALGMLFADPVRRSLDGEPSLRRRLACLQFVLRNAHHLVFHIARRRQRLRLHRRGASRRLAARRGRVACGCRQSQRCSGNDLCKVLQRNHIPSELIAADTVSSTI